MKTFLIIKFGIKVWIELQTVIRTQTGVIIQYHHGIIIQETFGKVTILHTGKNIQKYYYQFKELKKKSNLLKKHFAEHHHQIRSKRSKLNLLKLKKHLKKLRKK